jgi:hypothetical protein
LGSAAVANAADINALSVRVPGHVKDYFL